MVTYQKAISGRFPSTDPCPDSLGEADQLFCRSYELPILEVFKDPVALRDYVDLLQAESRPEWLNNLMPFPTLALEQMQRDRLVQLMRQKSPFLGERTDTSNHQPNPHSPSR